MENFIFENPTKIIFGKGQIPQIGTEVRRFGGKALLVYGMGSILKNGVHAQVVSSLSAAGVAYVELPGIKSNPLLSQVLAGIELARKEKVEVILAVGGGSVIDTAKAIAAGILVDHDIWDFFRRHRTIEGALPVLTVVTISASASEMNTAAVITKDESCHKFSINSPFLRPRVSVLDPTVLFSISPAYSAYSAVDIVTHMLEGYFNNTASSSSLQDRLMEGLIKTAMESTDAVLKEPENYDARANIMWASTLAFNGLTAAGLGIVQLPVHMIEHSLSALYDIAHGAGLSIVLPAWMTSVIDEKGSRLGHLGRRVFDVQAKDDKRAAEECIAAFKAWFTAIGSPVSLKQAFIPETDIEAITENAYALAQVWGLTSYSRERIAQILHYAC
ncbi:MAG: Long-chain-alcohol dehydrogenase 2 [Syntrophus sp. SKADARSKE-3]|nr:Long-chain-alcohol dehydrogenase 2 [Syntrophus sp. SKADARSKE-3]